MFKNKVVYCKYDLLTIEAIGRNYLNNFGQSKNPNQNLCINCMGDEGATS